MGYRPFASLCIGQVFVYGGTWWRKRSGRTAESLDRPDVWYYFGKNEVVVPS